MPTPVASFVVAGGLAWSVRPGESALWAEPPDGEGADGLSPVSAETLAELAERVAHPRVTLEVDAEDSDDARARRKTLTQPEKVAEVRAILASPEWVNVPDAALSRQFGYTRRFIRRIRRMLDLERGETHATDSVQRVVRRRDGRTYSVSMFFLTERKAAARRPR